MPPSSARPSSRPLPSDRPGSAAPSTPGSSPDKEKKKKKKKKDGEPSKSKKKDKEGSNRSNKPSPVTMPPTAVDGPEADAAALLAEVMAGTPRGSPLPQQAASSSEEPAAAGEEGPASARTSSSEETDTDTSDTNRSDESDEAPRQSVAQIYAAIHEAVDVTDKD